MKKVEIFKSKATTDVYVDGRQAELLENINVAGVRKFTYSFLSPVEYLFRLFGLNVRRPQYKRLVMVLKMVLLFVTTLMLGAILNAAALSVVPPVSYWNIPLIGLPLIGWIWFYFRSLW